jgi:hypothetical protein
VTLDEVNARIHAAYERLGVPPGGLRQVDFEGQACYSPQFLHRDPLMLLLSREAFGAWAPNRVAAEIGGHDIFRTFARFSAVDGVVTSEEAVWLFEPHKFYKPAPDPTHGDKRSAGFKRLLVDQAPWIEKLLAEYAEKGWVNAAFMANLRAGLLALPAV